MIADLLPQHTHTHCERHLDTDTLVVNAAVAAAASLGLGPERDVMREKSVTQTDLLL